MPKIPPKPPGDGWRLKKEEVFRNKASTSYSGRIRYRWVKDEFAIKTPADAIFLFLSMAVSILLFVFWKEVLVFGLNSVFFVCRNAAWFAVGLLVLLVVLAVIGQNGKQPPSPRA